MAVTEGHVCAKNGTLCSNFSSEMILYNVKPKKGVPRFHIYVEDGTTPDANALAVFEGKTRERA